jgi:activating signal cointegrator complex subunit 3
MPATLIPRLSHVLRVLMSEQAPADTDRDLLVRREKVVAYQAKAHAIEEAEQTLTWKSFAAAKPNNFASTQELKPVRAKFNKFLQIINEVLGGENAGDIGPTAKYLYDTLRDPSANDKEAQQKCFQMLGTVEQNTWTQLKKHAIELGAWQGVITSSPKKGAAAKREFGVDFAFMVDSNAEDSDPFEEDDYATSSSTGGGSSNSGQGSGGPSSSGGSSSSSGGSSSSSGGSSGGHDSTWLYLQCEMHVAMAESAFTAAELGKAIVETIQGQQSEEELQSKVFELLGENFDLIMKLLEHRAELGKIAPEDMMRVNPADEVSSDEALAKQLSQQVGGGDNSHDEVLARQMHDMEEMAQMQAEMEMRKLKGIQSEIELGGVTSKSKGYTPGCGFTVQSASQMKADKEQRKLGRKIQRRMKKDGDGEGEEGGDWLEKVGFSTDFLKTQREFGLQGGNIKGDIKEKKYATAHEELMAEKNSLINSKRALPEGTTREVFKGYEEVNIPHPKQLPVDKAKLIAIDQLDEFAQMAFAGMKSLNRLQSELFESAYHSNENMLVCAPTGAGKTNVAMLTLLRAVGQNMGNNNGVLDKKSFKVIYVAPMKALAQEVVDKFGKRLAALGLQVRECTGDMQLSKSDIDKTQVIVTTPEKWDVITRKSGEGSLMAQVKLLLIDEVHLLADERGPVIESLVARTLRHVESTQEMIRIVGLSATLPNYEDVGLFLRATPGKGLWHFDGSYRPVPLSMSFVGVTAKKRMEQVMMMNTIAYEKALRSIREGNQVLIFVHSRKDTARTAEAIHQIAVEEGTAAEFDCTQTDAYRIFSRDVGKSKNNDTRKLFQHGFGIHHAGMLRPDRSLSEKIFAAGGMKVLCCTATLAWGVNLPAHTVIIKGTQVYQPERGGNVDLSMLDVQQMFGRAGRPQYDTSGEAIMITTQDSIAHYLGMLYHQAPIESQFISQLPDHLNAEVVSGTVTNLREAITWMSYTYCFIRMLRNPMAYGITYDEKDADPLLDIRRRKLLSEAAQILDNNRMVRFDRRTGNLATCDLGRVASHYYIRCESINIYNEMLREQMTEAEIFHVIAHSKEFENIRVRDEELTEMEGVRKKMCPLPITGAIETTVGKANLLMQAYISKHRFQSFTLVSDSNYIAQNGARITRALFELCLKRNWCSLAEQMLVICKTVDSRIWWFQHPLRHFTNLDLGVIVKLEEANATHDKLVDMEASEIGHMMHHVRLGDKVKRFVNQIPKLEIEASIQPITASILRVTLIVKPAFEWHDRSHGTVQPWWIWVEDGENEMIYHSEYLLIHKKMTTDRHAEPLRLEFTIPVFQPLPPQYYVKAISDRWVGVSQSVAVSFHHLILPDQISEHTDLLDLQPLPVTALQNKKFEAIYDRFDHFNPVQTQMFHTLYHTDSNVLLGAPTGSGKTIAAELAILRLAYAYPDAKVVYVAPLKALARERINDWRKKFGSAEGGGRGGSSGDKLGWSVLELTGDHTPDMQALQRAKIIITTPEKWDGISRSWRKRSYVKQVQLLILDEVHLLGEERGAVLEVIVSRMRFIAAKCNYPIRFVALSTAVANANDLADWLGVKEDGLFNFRPSVRPVPTEVHIQGFPGKHYCPRMATMNKPAYLSIMQYSPTKPALVFVSSRRQTRLTALDLISYCATDENPRQFLHMDEQDMASLLDRIVDSALKHTLAFGIGIHHAGLAEYDRKTVEELFCCGKIQILVCTSTLAWGVNFPAHLVVIKGTEFYDGKLGRYVDFPVTDVLQMMGRAGRPQFDKVGYACILVHAPKKNFYRKFLYQPFPVESHLREHIHNHFNAEVATKTIGSIQDAVDYLTWTYFFRRLIGNPSYYHLEGSTDADVQEYLQNLAESVLADLEAAGTVTMSDDFLVQPTTLGLIASYYYLEYTSVGMFQEQLVDQGVCEIPELCKLLADAHEYNELPVRHNEDQLNAQLAEVCPWEVDEISLDSAHTKAYLLLQAHFGRLELPISDFINDTKSVMDQALRVLNAMVDIAADEGLLGACVGLMHLTQMVVQARFLDDSTLLQLPHVGDTAVEALEAAGIHDIRELASLAAQGSSAGPRGDGGFGKVRRVLSGGGGGHNGQEGVDMRPKHLDQLQQVAEGLPLMLVEWRVEVKGEDEAKGEEDDGADDDADGDGGGGDDNGGAGGKGGGGNGGEGKGGGGKGGGGKGGNTTGKLYVGNLSFETDKGSLRKEFSKFGHITDVYLPTDRETGQTRGFGFVTFKDPANAATAIEQLNGKDLDGRSIRVNLSDSGGDSGGGGGGGYSGGGGGWGKADAHEADWKAHTEGERVRVPVDSECVLHVRLRPAARRRGKASTKVYSTQFKRPKQHGYWLVMGTNDGAEDGDEEEEEELDEELLALKRMTVSQHKQETSLLFFSPEEPGEQSVQLFMVPDSIIGLDQSYTIPLFCEDDGGGGEED